MATRLKIEGLIDVLQNWKLALPQQSDTLADLHIKPGPATFGNLEAYGKASETLSETLRTLQELVKVIEKPAHELTASYRRARNRLLPLMRLPFELLSSIFEMACQPKAISPAEQPNFRKVVECRKTRFAIGFTCSYFRRVVLGTHLAWNHIPIIIDGRFSSLYETQKFLPSALARASHHALHLYVSIRHVHTTKTSGVMNSWKHLYSAFLSIRKRLKTLFIESDNTLSPCTILGYIPAGLMFPALRSLYLDIKGSSWPACLNLQGFPVLEILSIKYAVSKVVDHGLSIVCSPRSCIRELTLRGNFDEGQSVSLLKSCQNSIEVIRWISSKDWRESLPQPPLPALQLPHLQALHLEKPLPFQFLDSSGFDMQNLTSIFIDHPGHHPQQSDRTSTIVLPSLLSCKIGPRYWRAVSLASFFKNNPTIRTIKTRADLHDVTDFFLAAASTVGSNELLPNLRCLYCKGRIGTLNLVSHSFERIRARRHPFIIYVEAPGSGFDERLLDEYADVLRVKPFTAS